MQLMVEDLMDDDVIIEILSRLPVKSLLRFKVVCKSWCSFFDTYNSTIVGTCNGLFCLVTSELDVILWNPSTREFKTLPDSGTDVVLLSCTKYGFGYDKSLHDYKVVEISFYFREDKTNVKIYSLRTNSWRTISALRRGTFIHGCDEGAFANETLYWVAKYQESSGLSLVLVSFNMESKKFGMVKVPTCEVADDDFLRLVVLNGYLSMFCKNDKDGTDVWIMNEDGAQECWTKLASMANDGGIEDLMPLSILGNDEILVYCLNWIAIYNTKDDTLNKLGVYDPHVDYIDIYIESLISPKFSQ